jgi:hypothetical protein
VVEHPHREPETGVDLRLVKRIPSQSGLGGGSSDAAAAWLATAAALALEGSVDLDAERDAALARLGSDTVFFARAADTGAAWCTGRGEKVASVASPRGWSVALVTPDVAASTASVYAALNSPLSRRAGVPSLHPADGFPLPAVAARSREIATLEALGFGGLAVMISILVEALLLAALGGGLGATLAYFAFDGYKTATMNWQTFSQVSFAFDVTPRLMISAIEYALVIGLVGGLFPAIRAARLPLAMALRES